MSCDLEDWDEVVDRHYNEWYEYSQNEFGEMERSASKALKIDGKIVRIYRAVIDYRTNFHKCVIVPEGEVFNRVYSMVKDCCINLTIQNNSYIEISQPYDIAKIIKKLSQQADYPRMDYKIDGKKIAIQFSSAPPPKFKKRMRDFRLSYNMNKGLWVGYLETDDMDKLLNYFKKQYNR